MEDRVDRKSVGTNPTAIVTGAGRGIGRAIALELARRGYRLVLSARTQSEIDETARLCGGGIAVAGNIAERSQIDALADRALREFGRIDVAVHNAGFAPVVSIPQMTDEQWHAVIDTNLSAAFYLARAVWPTFVNQKNGVLVNISSAAARDPFTGLGAYGAAKAGLNLLGLALAREGHPIGVRVHTIAPGAVETAMFRQILTPEQFSTDKTMDPAEIARLVGQCVAGDLKHTSGEVIYVHKTV